MHWKSKSSEVPELFNGTFTQVVSEFGQSLNAKAGFLASRVEYTKPFEDHSGLTATLHFGADTCVRSAGCRSYEIVSSSEATRKTN